MRTLIGALISAFTGRRASTAVRKLSIGAVQRPT
jgi:hypothetical protein